MKTLAPNLFQRRFQDLLEIGRARLPSLAPEWTDHNAHDPGITLMELLAWVAEAQLYSLSRVRRDERQAYAALLGISPHGTQGASGMIWADRLAPNSPVSTYVKSLVLPEETAVNVPDGESSTFRPTHRLLWAPGRITKLETQDAKGRTTDHTITNERGGLPFLPFGERGGRHSVLALTFECRDKAGLLGNDPQSARRTFWPIGVLVAPSSPSPEAQAPEPSGQTDCSPITAAVFIDQKRTRLRIESDTTHGFLTTGTLLLDLSDIKTSPERLTIELGLPNGFSRPPRLLRIEPNVIPIRQVQTVEHEEETANGLPDWSFRIGVQPLLFATGAEPITLKVAESSGVTIWQRRDRISEDGPDDNVYEFDAESGEITFGNGINGRIPPVGSKVAVTFAVSDGEEGRVARNRKWNVAGFADTFGVNLDPIGGGIAASGFIGDRREARLRSREDHALISSADIAAAAKSLPLLEVARAWVPASPNNAPRTGVVTLVVMRSRPGGNEPELPPETAQWLKAISRLLSPRMPLGSRLSVVAPRYLEFTIDAVLEADAGRKPSAIEEEIEKELKKRLALVESPGVRPRQAGIPVTSRDIAAWLRAINGVRRVIQLQLRDSDGHVTDQVAVPRNGLPRWVAGAANRIEVKRPEPGRSR